MATLSAKMVLVGMPQGTGSRMAGSSSPKTNRVSFRTLRRAGENAGGERIKETGEEAKQKVQEAWQSAVDTGEKVKDNLAAQTDGTVEQQSVEAKKKIEEALQSAKATGQKVSDTLSAKTGEIKETVKQKT